MASFNIIDTEAITEPVTVAEQKAYSMIDADYSSNDVQIGVNITTARQRLEQYLNIGLANRDVTVIWNGGLLELPLQPIGAIANVFKNDETTPLTDDDYATYGYPKKIYIKPADNNNFNVFYNINGYAEVSLTNFVCETDFYKVVYNAGYETVDLPGSLKRAIMAEADYIYKLAGMPATDVISPNAALLAQGYSRNLVL
jgi:hypothetical protein